MTGTTPLRWLAAAIGLLASAYGGRAARRTQGRERLTWSLLAASLALAPASEVFAGPAAVGTVLHGLVLTVLYLTAALKPHLAARAAVRPARVADAVLLGLLLLGIQSYFESAARRTPARGLALLLGLLGAAALRSCAAQARSAHWQRIYRLLAASAASNAIGRATGVEAAPILEAMAAGLAAWAARDVTGTPAAEPAPSAGTGAVSAWRELAVPAASLAGLLGLALAEGPRSPWRGGPLSAAFGIYVLVLLVRQFLAQMENRALALDLQQESERLRLLLDNLHDAVLIEDLDGRIVFANDRFLELFGIGRQELPRLRLETCMHPDDRPLDREDRIGRLLAAPGARRFEFRGLRRDGTTIYVESSTVPVERHGLVQGFQSVMRDITERRAAEERQRELVQRLEFFVTNMPLGCMVFDLQRRILEWNNSAARIFGWTEAEVHGREALELLVPPEARPGVAAVQEELVVTKSNNHWVNQNLTKDGRRIECEWFNTSLVDHTGTVVGVASMVQDITERKNLEAQLRQSQKMEAVGVLAGGVAHDFNNLLTVISGNLSLTQMQLGKAHPAARGLADAEKAADRAAELVRQLLSFGRKSHTEPRPIRLNDRVAELSLLRRAIDPRIQIETRREPDLWLVDADAGQVDQMLMNLCVNARDAMPEGGRLTISTANRKYDEEACRTHPEARPGEFVELSVADTGVGIDDATRGRIFEPFFTTKAAGKGTGLGLAMVYGIVQQHGGWITVESEPGRGSVFSVFLPRSKSFGEEPAAASPTAATGGPETILLVDDEEMILRLARATLEAGGHRVLEARDGQEALEVFEKHREEIDLVLLDMIMPRKPGRETLAEIHNLAPEVPVVLASGYTPVGVEELAALGARGYVQKPYQPQELARTVRQVLDAAARADAPQQRT